MKRRAPEGIYGFRGAMGEACHLLVDGKDAWLLDTGLAGQPPFLRNRLQRLGLEPSAIRGILLTHGHLDHTGNLAALKEWTGAPVYAHAAEQRHVDGCYPYEGVARWCGRLEAAGRKVFRYRTAKIDETIQEGDLLPFWGGLRVVHLPGHTEGHCGFYSERHGLLFSGDLFASYFFNTHLPPPILNSCPGLIPGSLRRVLEMDPEGILPNHYDWMDTGLHKRRFRDLCGRVLHSRTEGGMDHE
jgi:glyoxylase-like metal-dependent hydrolase (beta-lactamase superfamily II)